MKLNERIVVAGCSLAGLRTIEALRRGGYEGEVIALCAEPHMPYDRPPLSKQFLQGVWDEDKISLRRQGFDDLEVKWEMGCRARALHPSRRELSLEGGLDSIAYGGLVLSTGSTPRPLPGLASLSGIHFLRGLDDARALRSKLGSARRLVVIGAGFIGMEVAASARMQGLEVAVIEALPSPLLRGLGTQMGEWVGARFRDEGVDLRCDVGVDEVLGRDRVEGVRLSDGQVLPADLVLIGIGVVPCCDWLEGSGLDISNGVLCDATGATGLPDVVAAGDVSRWNNPQAGEARRYEHWTSAVEQASVAAERLLAGKGPVSPLAQVPYVWSDLFDLRLSMAGEPGAGDELHVGQGTWADDRFLVLFGREGLLVGAVGLKRPRALNECRDLIAAGSSFKEAVAAES